MLTFSLNDEQKVMRDTIHKFAETEMRSVMRQCEKNGNVPDDLVKMHFELGLTTLDIPAQYGGQGLDMLTAVIVAEELAWGDPGIALGFGGPGLAGYAILALGNEEQKQRFLSPFSKPENYKMRGALALAETQGSALDELLTTAELKGSNYVLNGKKWMILHSDTAEFYIVIAKSDGLKAFVVERNASGLSHDKQDEKMGLIASPSGGLVLNDCKVSKDNLLDGEPDTAKGIAKAFDRIRLLQSAWAIGLSRAALEYAVNYSKERTAFGKPISQHQALAFMLADMATEVDAAKMMVWRAAWLLDKGQEVTKEITMATVQANEMSLKVTIDAVQLLGGHGYIQDHPVEKWMRDARTLSLLSGTSGTLNNIIASEIVGYQEEGKQ